MRYHGTHTLDTRAANRSSGDADFPVPVRPMLRRSVHFPLGFSFPRQGTCPGTHTTV